jgi:hypothetical protein
MFHYMLMPEHMFRVEVVQVIPGYEDQYPLVPPTNPEEEMNLGGVLGFPHATAESPNSAGLY